MSRMTFRDVIEQLSSFDDEQTIFLDRQAELCADTPAVVAWIPEDDSHPDEANGLSVFLDIWHAREIIEGKARLAKLSQPSTTQKLDLLIEYAKKDA